MSLGLTAASPAVFRRPSWPVSLRAPAAAVRAKRLTCSFRICRRPAHPRRHRRRHQVGSLQDDLRRNRDWCHCARPPCHRRPARECLRLSRPCPLEVQASFFPAPSCKAVIATGNAVAPFVISILVLAFATGFIKPCIAPILADQSQIRHQRVITLPSGERVIVDPSTTVATLLAWYYWSVNIGAVFQISTSYCAKIVGYWLAWLVPVSMCCSTPPPRKGR
jgi:hypothetical protein